MKNKTILFVVGAIFAAIFCLASSKPTGSTGIQAARQPGAPTRSGERAIAHLKESGQFESLDLALIAARYGAERSNDYATVTNYANHLRGTFTPQGVRLEANGKGARWQSRWRLETLDYGDRELKVKDGAVRTAGNRVTITHSLVPDSSYFPTRRLEVEEWFNNTPGGLEHGFTLPERPSNSAEHLRLTIAVDGDLSAQADSDGQTLRLFDQQGQEILSYEKLKVWDAEGAEVAARMTTEAGTVVLDVEEASAQYPLTIDPTFSAAGKLVGSNGQAFDEFGNAVAISGDTVIVGAHLDEINGNSSQGSAYIFVRGTNGLWTQQANLTAADGTLGDFFGESVAISGDTVVVGAFGDAISGNGDQGSAHVFVRIGTTWQAQQKLLASDGDANDFFGTSVGISGNTIIVGALGCEIGTNANEGAAYAFVRSGNNWSEQQKLVSAGGGAGDRFGNSVAIAGNTVVIGAFEDDVSADIDQGSAYIFTRAGSTWTLQQELIASDGAPGDKFGTSVDIDAGILSFASAIIGAPNDDINGGSNQGSAYVFTRSEIVWTQQQQLMSSDGVAGDFFGESVAIDNGIVVVGAPADDVATQNTQGSSYIFLRTGGTTWNQRQRILAFDGAASHLFGIGVDLSGTTAIVGAYRDDVFGDNSRGSAHIFSLGNEPYDFDDDTKADISVFRPSNGTWYRLDSSTGQFVSVGFGQDGDIPAAGDYDGDGDADIAVYRPSNGTWYLLQSTAGFASVQFGLPGDVPLPADVDGDGKADIRLYRPSNRTWYRINSATGGFAVVQFGANGDLPVGGDFDGDQKGDLGVFRPANGNWYVLLATGGVRTLPSFGASGDRPVPADFNGDGTTDYAVFRSSNGTWYRRDSYYNQFVAVAFGQNGDIPAPADFDGDGKSDIAVFRPSNGYWYLLNGTGFAAVQFGAAGDIPASAQP